MPRYKATPPLYQTYTTGYQHAIAVFNQTLASAQATFAPVAAQLAPYNNTSVYISTSYSTFPTCQSYYATLSGVQGSVGTSGALGSQFSDREAPKVVTLRSESYVERHAGLPGQYTINKFISSPAVKSSPTPTILTQASILPGGRPTLTMS